MSRLERIVSPMAAVDFVPAHPLRFKARSEYFSTYVPTVIRAIQTIGVPVIRAPGLLRDFVLEWDFGPELQVVRTLVDYSDYFYQRGPILGEPVHGSFKYKHHPSRALTAKPEAPVSMETTYPVVAGGFPLSLGAGTGDTDRFLVEVLPVLRERKDTPPQAPGLFFNDSHFRKFAGQKGPYQSPNRPRFAAAFDGKGLGKLTPQEYMEGIASHRWFLNVCGNGYSIDRKVVEACAIGTGIVSDRGLEDLELPWGGRFIHGENILFVDSPEEVIPMIASQSEADWRRLVSNSRATYEWSFHHEALGRWYFEKAVEWAVREAAGKEDRGEK